jgi:hypothetical protein
MNDFILQIQKANFKRLKFERFFPANSKGEFKGTAYKFPKHHHDSMAKIRR